MEPVRYLYVYVLARERGFVGRGCSGYILSVTRPEDADMRCTIDSDVPFGSGSKNPATHLTTVPEFV